MREWCTYKTALILPVANDLSTRIFDALVAGLVVLVPRRVADLGLVIEPSLQEELGILRFDTCDLQTIKNAHQQAIAFFDREGMGGVSRRHTLAVNHHMLPNRIKGIVEI